MKLLFQIYGIIINKSKYLEYKLLKDMESQRKI